jgi:hypothetical protein
MSADPFVQDPTNTQSLNRYSYVGNNPLSYTDPTGYFSLGKFLKTLIAIVVVVVAAIYGQGWVASAIYGSGTAGAAACAAACATIAGAIGGAIAGGITGGNLRSVVTGAISGAVFARLGFAAKAGAWTDSQRFVAFGLTGGVSSVAQGGNFQSGFLAAGFSALAQPYIDVVANDNVFVGAAASAAVGGTASVLGGGKFANGAVTGAFSYAVGRAIGPTNENVQYARSQTGTTTDAPDFLGSASKLSRWLKKGGLIGILNEALEVISENVTSNVRYTVYRVFDGLKAKWDGVSWGIENPALMADWRDTLAVYPAWNQGTMYVEGTVTQADLNSGRVQFSPNPGSIAGYQPYNAALGGGPYSGMGTEWLIPDARNTVKNPVFRMMPLT